MKQGTLLVCAKPPKTVLHCTMKQEQHPKPLRILPAVQARRAKIVNPTFESFDRQSSVRSVRSVRLTKRSTGLIEYLEVCYFMTFWLLSLAIHAVSVACRSIWLICPSESEAPRLRLQRIHFQQLIGSHPRTSRHPPKTRWPDGSGMATRVLVVYCSHMHCLSTYHDQSHDQKQWQPCQCEPFQLDWLRCTMIPQT